MVYADCRKIHRIPSRRYSASADSRTRILDACLSACSCPQMASENDYVVLPGYRNCRFLFATSSMEENEGNTWQRISVSPVPDSSAASWFGVCNYDSVCAP